MTFKAAQRGNFNQGGQDFDVYLDSTLLATFRPASSSYSTLSTPAFTTTTGSHTLKFQGRDSSGGDNTALIDAVTITGTGTVADTGTVTITVNGTPYTYNYGAGDTASTVATGLTNAINAGSLARRSPPPMPMWQFRTPGLRRRWLAPARSNMLLRGEVGPLSRESVATGAALPPGILRPLKGCR